MRAAGTVVWMWLSLSFASASVSAFQRCDNHLAVKPSVRSRQKAPLHLPVPPAPAGHCSVDVGKPKWNHFSALNMAGSSREDEIKRKIMKLKRQGKLKSNNSVEDTSLAAYEEKVKQRLGSKKSSLLGFGDTREGNDDASDILAELDSLDDDPVGDTSSTPAQAQEQEQIKGRIGALAQEQVDTAISPEISTSRVSIDPSLFKEAESDGPELSEDELVALVAAKLAEKQTQGAKLMANPAKGDASQQRKSEKTTSGIGGTWQKDTGNSTDLYKPKSGSWGAFPRPKDISKAYGGGRRVGAGFSKEDDAIANVRTQKRLKDYRRKVGIDVPTEQEHASEIEEALEIAQLAMQRGIYATAVSSLEKVTKWCSTNSKVGSKVFLELAMAYEATGRTQEAYQVYKTLTTCRMEDVKFNAKRLLYGLEAMEIMRDVSSDFSRQKIKNTFMDATGLRDIAQNFDDVYQTAYVDLDNGFYKKLTESVVRSNREARQILLKATGKGEIGRLKVVQALRSLARHFDDALEMEMESEKRREPTAFLNGKPIVVEARTKETDSTVLKLDEFVLSSPQQMTDNLHGLWRLQLLADKQGDGVSFFNKTTAIQEFSTTRMDFIATGPSGFTKVTSSGKWQMDNSRRVLSRSEVTTEGATGNILGLFGSNKNSGFLAAVSLNQQIISVDSALLLTKSPAGSRKGKDADKEHFAVWRRVAGSEEKTTRERVL
jgi:hypothetical protein